LGLAQDAGKWVIDLVANAGHEGGRLLELQAVLGNLVFVFSHRR
jgi:hypothetical protein